MKDYRALPVWWIAVYRNHDTEMHYVRAFEKIDAIRYLRKKYSADMDGLYVIGVCGVLTHAENDKELRAEQERRKKENGETE